MATYLLVFAVCLLVIGSTLGVLLLSRTPRYRTEPHDLLALFDRALNDQIGDTEWQTIVGYPIRHDAYLESVRRRAQRLMEDHGRPWRASRGGSLLSPEGKKELSALRDHLAAHTALRERRHDSR
ncbi:hypothetical protein [Litchfieldella xinjiangensis]|uniref:hypothetical protein n=1 Tax=Litchfieldella xinjiangensis TaxID=1166948 RepID=UPI0005BC6F47|nr:hypothetical protein [Halomonas xinjiangensis]